MKRFNSRYRVSITSLVHVRQKLFWYNTPALVERDVFQYYQVFSLDASVFHCHMTIQSSHSLICILAAIYADSVLSCSHVTTSCGLSIPSCWIEHLKHGQSCFIEKKPLTSPVSQWYKATTEFELRNLPIAYTANPCYDK